MSIRPQVGVGGGEGVDVGEGVGGCCGGDVGVEDFVYGAAFAGAEEGVYVYSFGNLRLLVWKGKGGS